MLRRKREFLREPDLDPQRFDIGQRQCLKRLQAGQFAQQHGIVPSSCQQAQSLGGGLHQHQLLVPSSGAGIVVRQIGAYYDDGFPGEIVFRADV
nr:hypothetical protein [Rhodoferax sp. UBA5149]